MACSGGWESDLEVESGGVGWVTLRGHRPTSSAVRRSFAEKKRCLELKLFRTSLDCIYLIEMISRMISAVSSIALLVTLMMGQSSCFMIDSA